LGEEGKTIHKFLSLWNLPEEVDEPGQTWCLSELLAEGVIGSQPGMASKTDDLIMFIIRMGDSDLT